MIFRSKYLKIINKFIKYLDKKSKQKNSSGIVRSPTHKSHGIHPITQNFVVISRELRLWILTPLVAEQLRNVVLAIFQ